MKNILTLLLMVFVACSLNAQKANVKNKNIKVQFANLPYNYVEPDQRTFSVSGPSTDDLVLYGWEFVEENGTVHLRNSGKRFAVGASQIDKKVKENKDKDGNVTSKTTSYAVKSVSKGNWVCTINGPRNELLTDKEKERLAKKEAKKKQKAKEEPEEENPFLSGVDVEPDEEEEMVSREGFKNYRYYESRSWNYSTGYKKTATLASSAYRREIEMKSTEFKNEFNDAVNSFSQSMLNKTYGYGPVRSSLRFKLVGGKKHAEYKMSNDAYEALAKILGKMKFNQPIDQVKTDVAPLISYYEGLIKKYGVDNKQDKKVRTVGVYNLAQLYYVLDQPEKSKKYAQQLVDEKLDKQSGNRYVKRADDLMKQLAHHHMDSRHLILEIDEESIKIEDEEGADEEVEAGN